MKSTRHGASARDRGIEAAFRGTKAAFRGITMLARIALALLAVTVMPAPAGAAHWVNLTPATGPTPPARAYTTAAYDSGRHRLIVFGGEGASGQLNDVWAFDLAARTWSELVAAPGPRPSARITPANVYDPSGDRLITWSGMSGGTFLNDAWSFDLDSRTWTQYPATAPWPLVRYGVAAIFDPAAGDLVTFAGFTSAGRFFDTQRLHAASGSWTDVTPGAHPPERCLHSASHDSRDHRMIMYGGQMSGPLGDIWAFDLDTHTWENLTPASSPPGRWFPTQVYDATNHRAIVFGGNRGTGLGKTNEVWAFRLDPRTWQQVIPAGAGPSAREGAASIHVPGEDRMVIFGGKDSAHRNDVWSLEGLSPSSGVGAEGPAGEGRDGIAVRPNPSRGEVRVSLAPGRAGADAGGDARIDVLDVRGREVRRLWPDRDASGPRSVIWDGRDSSGREVGAGIYFIRLQSGNERRVANVVIVR